MPSTSKALQRRESRRFEIRCPVTVEVVRKRGKATETREAILYDIAVGGARFGTEEPLPEGAPVAVHVHFRHASEKETTLRFEGIVTRLREGPRYEIAVQFQSNGRFVPSELKDLLTS